VLGAIGGGLAAGMTLAECAKGIANVAPFDGRMQPVSTPDGVTFIRDDWKGTLWTVDASFAFMQEAQATRKIIVIGTLADCGSGVPQKLERVARWAQEIADHTVFVGHWASNVLKTRKPWEDKLRAFSHVRDATQYVNSITREGDLVLLKGTSKQDHLQRIILARHGDVACWRDDCNRYSFCSECPDLHKPSGAPLLLHRQPPHGATHQLSPSARQILQSDCFVIVGLGNPEVRYANTPHNLGYEVVEKLAESMGLIWKTTPEAWLALGSFMERAVCLIKVKTPMNGTGAGLKQLAESMAFFPAQCVLVYDDLNLPLGIVKMRLSGGAGGHRGVASILEAFQTDAFRRVKVGAGKAGERLDFVNFVLTAFDDETRAVVDRTILTAETRVLDFMNLPTKRNQGEHAPNDRPETLYD
jgi:aminoacyl-tRNA hydrolase